MTAKESGREKNLTQNLEAIEIIIWLRGNPSNRGEKVTSRLYCVCSMRIKSTLGLGRKRKTMIVSVKLRKRVWERLCIGLNPAVDWREQKVGARGETWGGGWGVGCMEGKEKSGSAD